MTKDSIIPYSIIESLSEIDNIFEMRLFGWIFAKAQSVMKVYNKDLSAINLNYAMNLVRITFPAHFLLTKGDLNYKHIEKAFKLADRRVYVERDGFKFPLHIIAFPEFVKIRGVKHFTCVMHNELWHALLDFSKGYRLVELPTYMHLKSTYSIIMLLLCSNQQNPMRFTLDTLRKLLGVSSKTAYKRNGNFIAKCIEPARAELQRVSYWSFEYSLQKVGQAYTSITIQPCHNTPTDLPPTNTKRDDALRSMRTRLDDRVSDYLRYHWGFDNKGIETVERYLATHGTPEQQLTLLAAARTAALRNRAQNPKGYLVGYLKGSV